MCFVITDVNHNLSLPGPAHGPQRGRHKQVGLKISLSLKNNFTSQNQEAYLYQSPRSLSEVVQELTKNGIDHLLPTKYGIHYGLSFPYFSLYSYLLYFCWLSNCCQFDPSTSVFGRGPRANMQQVLITEGLEFNSN